MSKRVICGICYDGLCRDHERDCTFDGTIMEVIGGPCACPNNERGDNDE